MQPGYCGKYLNCAILSFLAQDVWSKWRWETGSVWNGEVRKK